MLPPHLLPHTVTRIRPSESTNSHGDEALDYTVPPATSASITAWLQQQKPSEPITDGRQPLIREWLLMTNDEVQGRDRIAFGSLTFEVDGPPAPVYTPGGLHHYEANLRLVEG